MLKKKCQVERKENVGETILHVLKAAVVKNDYTYSGDF